MNDGQGWTNTLRLQPVTGRAALPSHTMSLFSSSQRLPTVATFVLKKGILLKVARGSVVDFGVASSSSPDEEDDTHEQQNAEDDNDDHNNKRKLKKRVGAIVNAANERCLGGGGVDGAISNAGGENLFQDRLALPILKPSPRDDDDDSRNNSSNDDSDAEKDEAFVGRAIRCRTGSAVITGPSDYGPGLKVPFVIHAVGPMYFQYEDFEVPDRLLGDAYTRSLDLCQENGITDVAFSLLSAGVFRGARELRTVLQIGIESISMWCAEHHNGEILQSVTLCGFNAREAKLTENVAKEVAGKPLDDKTVKGDHPPTDQYPQQGNTEEHDEPAMNASEDQQQETFEEHEPAMNDSEEPAVETADKDESAVKDSEEPYAETMEELKPANNESEEPASETMEEEEPTENESEEPAPETMEEEKHAPDTEEEHEAATDEIEEPAPETVEEHEPVTAESEDPTAGVDPNTKENGKLDAMEGDTSDGDENDGGAKRKRSISRSDGSVPAIADTSPTDEDGSMASPEHKKAEFDTEGLS